MKRRDIFNKALLRKRSWSIMEERKTLWHRVIGGKYGRRRVGGVAYL